jgi:hypothetical protein
MSCIPIASEYCSPFFLPFLAGAGSVADPLLGPVRWPWGYMNMRGGGIGVQKQFMLIWNRRATRPEQGQRKMENYARILQY